MPYKYNPFTNNFDDSTTGPAGTVSAAGSGTALLPGISFASDPNTGIYNPNPDQLAISTGGTGRLFIDASGNVGINDATPNSYTNFTTLSLNGTTGSEIDLQSGGTITGYLAATASYCELYGANGLRFLTSGVERLRITSAGLVGIGTASPGDRLELQGGTFRISINSLQYHTIAYSSNNFLFTANAGASNQNSDFIFSSSTAGGGVTERLRITSAGVLHLADAGNITVGTTTGTKIGTATTQKLGFYNATPVVQPAAVANITTTATAGSLPTPDGTVTIADATTPTVTELLEYCVELESKLEAALGRLRDLGLIAT